MKNITKYLAIFIVMLFAYNVKAQNITIHTANAQVTIFNGGKLNLNGNDSKFRSNSTDTTFLVNNGEIHFKGTDNLFTDTLDNASSLEALGASAAMRVPGLIYYSSKSTSDPQNVQSRWYSSLTMDSAASKIITDGVYIGATYLATADAGDRTYSDNFYYDGTTDQPIFGEEAGAGSAYANLVFQNAGVKTLATGQTADAENFTSEATATGGVVISGTMSIAQATTLDAATSLTITDGTFNTGAGAGDLSGTVTISGTTGGILTTADVGLVTINGTTNVNAGGTLDLASGDVTISSTGTLELADAATAELNVGESRTMTVTGTFTNAHAAAVNMTFFDNATDNSTNSTVIYDGAAGQSIVATVETNPYSNLRLETDTKLAPAAGIVLAGSFELADANLDMKSASNAVLRMMDDAPTATASYGGSEFEVVGRMRRDIGSSNLPLTFNNDSTRLTITSPENVDDFTLDVVPNVTHTPTEEWDYEPDNDIKRRINYDYTATGTDWAVEMQYGFKENEAPTGKWDDPAFLNTLRMREILSITTSDKVSTGVQPLRNDGSDDNDNFRAITLATIRGTGGAQAPQSELAEVTDGNGLFLRGGPALFISVRPGRWSNPATWDEGEQPGAEDRAAIRHNVHIGFTAINVDNYAGNEDDVINDKSGGVYPNRSTIASEILINDKYDVTGQESDKATLIVGGTSNVGITPLSGTLATLVPNNGSILINRFTGTAGSLDQTTMDGLLTYYTNTATATQNYNLGLLVLPNSSLTVPNNFDARGLVNIGGELNSGEQE